MEITDKLLQEALKYEPNKRSNSSKINKQSEKHYNIDDILNEIHTELNNDDPREDFDINLIKKDKMVESPKKSTISLNTIKDEKRTNEATIYSSEQNFYDAENDDDLIIIHKRDLLEDFVFADEKIESLLEDNVKKLFEKKNLYYFLLKSLKNFFR